MVLAKNVLYQTVTDACPVQLLLAIYAQPVFYEIIALIQSKREKNEQLIIFK
jgi:hypothetical protein